MLCLDGIVDIPLVAMWVLSFLYISGLISDLIVSVFLYRSCTEFFTPFLLKSFQLKIVELEMDLYSLPQGFLVSL